MKNTAWLGRAIGTGFVVSLLVFALWAYDVWKDRKHTVMVQSETEMFAGVGDEGCGGSRLSLVQSGATLRVRRIRYWKNCATVDVVLPDGKNGYIVLDSHVRVVPPL